MTDGDLPEGLRRWPVHPEPGPGEALTSWLGRLAGLYRLSVEQLLTHNLGAASAEFDCGADLDYQVPTIIVHALAARTGVEVDQVRRMTIAGCVPWLADTLNPAEGPQAFAAYVRKESVLLPPGQAGYHVINRWRPPRPVPDAVAALDRLTFEGITTTTVTLPAQTVHVGEWLRLLRTLLDEVSMVDSRAGPSAAAVLHQIWDTAGLPFRAGLAFWRPYERLSPPRQEAMLHAAATAVQLAADGTITPGGTLGSVLRPAPHVDGSRDIPLESARKW
ncbi:MULTISPECIES: TniQ family protein [unclassified Nonomuraea]|uniref:TniQ family protein n=1 Tax=unclassified Nonomuraea TaxID=2593643 RepID=UPI0034119700